MRRGYDYDIEQYKSAVKLMSYDGSIMWHIMQAFLLPQSIILTYVLTSPFAYVAKDLSNFSGWQPQIFFIALFCFVLCIPWYLLCNRSIASYEFSATNARHLEPEGWKVIGGERTRYFEGKEVSIGGESLRLKWHSKIKIRRTSHIIIYAFAIAFLSLVVLSLPLSLSKVVNILKEVKMNYSWFIVIIVAIIGVVIVIRMEYLKQMAVIKKRDDLKKPTKEGLLIAGFVLLAIGLSLILTELFAELWNWLYLPGSLFLSVGIALIPCFHIVKRLREKTE